MLWRIYRATCCTNPLARDGKVHKQPDSESGLQRGIGKLRSKIDRSEAHVLAKYNGAAGLNTNCVQKVLCKGCRVVNPRESSHYFVAFDQTQSQTDHGQLLGSVTKTIELAGQERLCKFQLCKFVGCGERGTILALALVPDLAFISSGLGYSAVG